MGNRKSQVLNSRVVGSTYATGNGNSHTRRFGVFELDLRAAELRRSGMKVKLHGQPFQVLSLLLEKPGEVVGREEMRKRLWPADTVGAAAREGAGQVGEVVRVVNLAMAVDEDHQLAAGGTEGGVAARARPAP